MPPIGSTITIVHCGAVVIARVIGHARTVDCNVVVTDAIYDDGTRAAVRADRVGISWIPGEHVPDCSEVAALHAALAAQGEIHQSAVVPRADGVRMRAGEVIELDATEAVVLPSRAS